MARHRCVRILTTVLFCVGVGAAVSAQAAGNAPGSGSAADLTSYYRSPIAIGAEYHSITPFGDYVADFTVFEAAATARFSLPESPALQPLIRAGYVDFNSIDEEFPDKWDHFHIAAGGGAALASRLSRTFELAGEASASYSQTWYQSVVDVPVGYPAILGAAGLRISLIPSFNFSVDVASQVRYLYGLGDVDRFDGFAVSVGIGATFRTGTDPDAPQADIRSLRFLEAEVPDAFAALQSWYVSNPLGTVSFENADRSTVRDVSVLFFQPGFMDSPTPAAQIDQLDPGEAITVDLPASFNADVFETEGITPLTGEIIVQYTRNGRAAEQRRSVTYDLHDKTALTWTDDRKMGAFITPADSAVRNYASYVRQQNRDEILDGVSEPLQVAMLAYHALEELGIAYQLDPASPFVEVQGDTNAVDSISLPRDTLTRLTGDCDDLTALYTTMLESVGIETAFVTTPGHIYVAVNTGVAPSDYANVHPDRRQTIVTDSGVWVPVEITMLGQGGFRDAWQYGVDEWHAMESTPDRRGFYPTSEAQSIYRPVGLRQTDLGLQYGDMDRVARAFQRTLTEVSADVLGDIRDQARERDDERSWNRYGIMAARWGQYAEAREAFARSARLDDEYLSPRINLGTVSFLQRDYEGAMQAFLSARRALEEAGRTRPATVATVYINLARAQYELGRFDDAQQNYSRAASADPELASGFAFLDQQGATGSVVADSGADADSARSGRASAVRHQPEILFAEDE